MEKDIEIADKLVKEGILGSESFEKIKSANDNNLFSVGFELRTLLSAGVLLLSSGLGVLVYKNIDTIGQLAVILFIAVVSFSCLGYCYIKRKPYSREKVNSPGVLYDYIMLLGCLTFATFTSYLQYQYSVFGSHNGIAMLLPAILFFALAYYVDHIGVLSLAITCLAAFVGIAITPIELLRNNDFRSYDIILSGLALGVGLSGAAIVLANMNIKKHFKFTYLNFATHLIFISCIAGILMKDSWPLFGLVLIALVCLSYWNAMRDKSFYYLFFTALYGYVGVGCLFFRCLFNLVKELPGEGAIYIGYIYCIGSSVFTILFLVRSNRKLKRNAGI